MQFTNRKVIAALLIPCFLYLAWVAGRWGMADIYARPAIITMNKWKQGEVRLDESNWKELQQNLGKALQLDPNNPELLHWMGTAIAGPYQPVLSDPVAGNVARREAIDYYRSSLRLQPTWPYPWDDIARVKFRSGEIDAEYFEAVHKAVELGPWEIGIQGDITSMGVLLWPDLPEAEKVFFGKYMADSLNHGDRDHALKSLKLLSRTGILADIGSYHPRLAIDGILRHFTNASRETVKEMLVMLDESKLWEKLSAGDNKILNDAVTRSVENANPQFVQEMNAILERNKR